MITKHQPCLPRYPKKTQYAPYSQEQHTNMQDLAAHLAIIFMANIKLCTKTNLAGKTQEKWRRILNKPTQNKQGPYKKHKHKLTQMPQTRPEPINPSPYEQLLRKTNTSACNKHMK